MFHARIVSPRGSLYLAAEATPYDLENLCSHIRELRRSQRVEDTRLELSIDAGGAGVVDRHVAALLHRLAGAGVQVTLHSGGWTSVGTPSRAGMSDS